MAKKLIKQASFGEALHVALRKCCDSTPTTVAYNMVKLMPYSIWDEWLKFTWTEFGKCRPGTKPDKVAEVFKSVALSYDPGGYFVGERDMDRKKPGSQREFINSLPKRDTVDRAIGEILVEREYWRWAWHGVLKMFDDRDWGGFTAYLVENR